MSTFLLLVNVKCFIYQDDAEVAVKEMLREIARGTRSKTGGTRLQAEESMDDGAKIVISINIDENEVHTYV